MKARIVIVDDHRFLRDLLRRMLIDRAYTIVGEAGDGSEAVSLVVASAPDILLLDLMLPEMNGFEVAEKVRVALPAVKIIALSAIYRAFEFYLAERARFDGFLDKHDCTANVLFEAIETVLGGHQYVSAAYLRARMARVRDTSSFDKILTEREQVVLGLIGLAATDAEIAGVLSVTSRTAETFRHHIMTKLEIHCSPALVRFSIENGFVCSAKNLLSRRDDNILATRLEKTP